MVAAARSVLLDWNTGKIAYYSLPPERSGAHCVRVPLIGRFNVANSLAALAAAHALGVGLREAVLSLAKSPQVPGRLEIVPAKRQFRVFVDYAHTPDALLNVLKTLRELAPRRVIVVFGCGGDRDREKRPLMGQVVDQNADYAIITSDNPRKEDPDKIIADVEKGFRDDHFEKITDRAPRHLNVFKRHSVIGELLVIFVTFARDQHDVTRLRVFDGA